MLCACRLAQLPRSADPHESSRARRTSQRRRALFDRGAGCARAAQLCLQPCLPEHVRTAGCCLLPWHSVERHDDGRHHVRWQPRPDSCSESGRVSGSRRHIRYQLLRAGGVLEHQDHHQLHAGRLCERMLDLVQLHPEAAQLDLHSGMPKACASDCMLAQPETVAAQQVRSEKLPLPGQAYVACVSAWRAADAMGNLRGHLVVQAAQELQVAIWQPAHEVAWRGGTALGRGSLGGLYKPQKKSYAGDPASSVSSPVRYMRLWCRSPRANGLATNFSAVRSGRLM